MSTSGIIMDMGKDYLKLIGIEKIVFVFIRLVCNLGQLS